MVDRIKALCKAQNSSVTKLEMALGFGNGTIGKWRNAKGAPPADRLQMVADALGVTTDYILNGNKNKPTENGELTEKQKRAFEIIMSMSESSLDRFIETAEMFGK